jgi:hypothetical protein
MPSKISKSEEWIAFHKALARFGPKVANAEWLKFWADRETSQANDLALRTYLKTKGITISESAFDSAIDKGAGVLGFFGNMFSIGKYVGIGLAVVAVGGLAMIVYNVAKNPVGAAGAAIKLRTGGMGK